MAKFKVGDKVRFIRPYNSGEPGLIRGQIYTVTKLHADGYLILEEMGKTANFGLGFRPDRFELVTPTAQPSELEQLVATANAGLAAIAKIEKRRAEVEIISSSGTTPAYPWAGVSFGFLDGKFSLRIKQKPSFDPFTVGQGWRVELRGTDRVAVGCREFNLNGLREALRLICECKWTEATVESGGEVLRPTRIGVSLEGSGDSITWSDADKLLAALNKVVEVR